MESLAKVRRVAAPASTQDPAEEEIKGPRGVIEQAARDISRGLRDTDLHGTPSNVPGPGPDPEHSPGADVPVEGPDGPAGGKPGTRGRREKGGNDNKG